MLDFKLKIFYAAASSLSFTKAAEELFISQPAVSKQVKLLELQLGHDLFERQGGKLHLTQAGLVLKQHIEQVLEAEKQLHFDLGMLSNEHKGIFTLGASTTIAQYIIPQVLLKFSAIYPKLEVKMLSGNTNDIERAMLDKTIDLGVVEGVSHRSGLRYTHFMDDKLVVVCHQAHPLAQRGEITLELLRLHPILLRERGSGTLEVIEYALKEQQLKLSDLNVKLYLGSTESIKSALTEGTCIAIVSQQSIQDEVKSGKLRMLPIKDIEFSRELAFIEPVGGATGIASTFIQFANHSL